ncbi:hypothetical protein JWG42_10425 [Desulfoprunum benzoelyticum]|uniref:Uncharacterized protein n=1 Tax=Desulfoprunum benzoelyticum TaxID=1506996 RepID=A0A840UW32_9BACT|nr:hypothetical protein [Desulfoprunum benzoelyticum]MBB5349073.1 hypothetical protein [Desulfoprunum benzoelyticum]MBM9530562.1 hypothetical protein [Desulfoprunum benzoelyticum]
MQIEIDRKDYKKSRNKKTENPVWAVVWRFLLISAIIDGGIYFYFHKIQNITVSEGIRRIRLAIHGNTDQNTRKFIVNKEYQKKNITNNNSESKTKNISRFNENYHTNNLVQHSSYEMNTRPVQRLDKLYCWVEEDGSLHFSNIGFPSTKNFKVISCERQNR